MVLNSNGKVENLLIIGNGFDLSRKLPTSFDSYIKNYKKMISNKIKQNLKNF